ncbi:PepSY-associated TM helix domain-containing protein [Gordonia hankookensis]|uniref:PepSY domain-containing protein n=1 Tax=Gordonia hankookensis TaxID=589403 RepID=A0ABR7WET3_9ACTN|nr:PepSY domain-containing protein [Gordonia hankookensis]MBD1321061.1 PepSY domain-containing protein [Gordonia hankookensis]
MSLTQEPPRQPLDSSPPTDPAARPPGGRHIGWEPLVRRLHFYAGILIAPFLIVAVVSGGLYALAPSLEKVVYREQLHTDSTGPARPVADQIRAAMAARPDLTLSAVRPAAAPGDTTRVLFDDPSLGESERMAVFVDPVTARPVGELVSYGSAAALPMRTWISQLHRHLHLGEPGRLYSELAASWLWVIALAGLALWIARYRRMRHGRAARLISVDRSTKGRARTLNWHGAVGVWIVVGVLFLSATGLTWSRLAGDHIGELRQALSWTTPSVSTSLDDSTMPAGGPSGHGDHAAGHAGAGNTGVADTVGQVDSVLAVADRIGVTDHVEVSVPTDTTTAFTVAETRQPWQFSPNSVSIDGANGHVVDVSWFADWPLAAQLSTWGIALHMGLLFGLANQIALLLLAIGLLAVIVRGYQMWWQRRPRRSERVLAVGRAPLRGAWRELPVPTIVAIIVIAVAVGWFIPLLGISLAAFILVDGAVGYVNQSRRNRR